MNLDTPELDERRARNLDKWRADNQKTIMSMAERWSRMQAIPGTFRVVSERVDSPVDEPHCSVCDGYRFVADDEGKMKPCPACRVVEKRVVAKLDRYSSANGRATVQTFENFDTTPARCLVDCLNACKEFAGRPSGWLLIHGTMGNGKSHLCAATVNALKERDVPVVFVTMPDLVQSLKALFDARTAEEEGETYNSRLRVYQTAPVLIVDDIGAERATDWSEGLQFEIFNARYRDRLPTMFTMNYRPDDAGRFDRRLIDRWREAGFCRVIHNSAPSRRH